MKEGKKLTKERKQERNKESKNLTEKRKKESKAE